jgi:hypothetical protein
MKLEDYYKGGYKQDQLSSGISAEALFEPTYYEIKKDINGGFRVGCYQYLYQYFRKGGSSSPISLCSETIGLFGGDHEYNYNFTRNETSEPLTMFSQDSGTSENGTVNYRIGLEIPKSSIYNTDEDYISI